MKNLIAAGNLYLKKMELTDVPCSSCAWGPLGVLIGLGAAKKHKRGAGRWRGWCSA